MSNFATLEKKFGKNKRLTKLVAVKKPCQLVFNELLVYSTLIFRAKDSALTARKVSTLTGLHESVTVPKVLTRLQSLGLCSKEKSGYRANHPPEEINNWFSLRQAETLANRFDYNYIGARSADSPLTILQAAIIPMLVLKHDMAAIARFLRVSKRTVARTAGILAENDNKFKLSWFQDKGKVERKARIEPLGGQVEKAKAVPLAELLGVGSL